MSFHKMIPSDWFLVPPSYERDMSATRDSLRELQGFLQRFPDSQYTDEAEELVKNCLSRLARHEMYVARFYLRRDKNQAAINRTKVVEEQYAKSGLVPEAMFIRGETYMNMDELEQAQETFVALAKRYPNSPEAGRARDYLQHMGVEVPAATAAGTDEGEEVPDAQATGTGERPTDDEP